MNANKTCLYLIFAALSGALTTSSFARGSVHALGGGSIRIAADGTQEVAFSPNAGATDLVVKVISSARKSIRLAAYSFTSNPIAAALIAAKKRGVDVAVVVDKSQKSDRYTSAAFLADMGIPVRIDSMHAIQHNKFIVVDGRHVETGSFNFTMAADKKTARTS